MLGRSARRPSPGTARTSSSSSWATVSLPDRRHPDRPLPPQHERVGGRDAAHRRRRRARPPPEPDQRRCPGGAPGRLGSTRRRTRSPLAPRAATASCSPSSSCSRGPRPGGASRRSPPSRCSASRFIGAGSRGPVVGLVAGLFVMLALSVGDRASRRRLVLLAVALTLSVAIVPQLVPGQNVSRSLSVLVGGNSDAAERTSRTAASTSVGRLQNFSDHPFTGIGTGSFAHNDPVAIYPHNIFLRQPPSSASSASSSSPPDRLRVRQRDQGLARVGGRGPPAGRARRRLPQRRVVNAQFSGDLALNPGIWLGAGLAMGLVQRVVPTSPGQSPSAGCARAGAARARASPSARHAGRLGRALPAAATVAPLAAPQRTPAWAARSRARRRAPSSGARSPSPAARAARGGRSARSASSTPADGTAWVDVGEAVAEQTSSLRAVARRRPPARRRAPLRPPGDEMRRAIAGEHGVPVTQIEIRPAKRRVAGGDTRELLWTAAASRTASTCSAP